MIYGGLDVVWYCNVSIGLIQIWREQLWSLHGSVLRCSRKIAGTGSISGNVDTTIIDYLTNTTRRYLYHTPTQFSVLWYSQCQWHRFYYNGKQVKLYENRLVKITINGSTATMKLNTVNFHGWSLF